MFHLRTGFLFALALIFLAPSSFANGVAHQVTRQDAVCGFNQRSLATASADQDPVIDQGYFSSGFFDSSDFLPRWYCGNWSRNLGWLHILSDSLISGAYFAIPCVLLIFLLQRPDLPFPKIIWLFSGFILACGFGHMIEALIFWWPIYKFAGLVKAFTAVISWVTVFVLIHLMPSILRIPSTALMAKQLRDNSERLTIALDAGNIGLWEWYPDKDEILLDSRAREIFDVDPEFTMSTRDDFESHIHPEDRQRVSDAIRASMETRSPYCQSFRFQCQDGSIRFIQGQGRVVEGDENHPLIMTGVCQDFTERQRSADLLAETETNYRATFENMALGIAHVAPDGRWIRVNDGLCRILGYSREQLLETTFQAMTHPNDLQADLVHCAEVLDGKLDSYTMEKRYRRADGSFFWANLSVSIVRTNTGEPRYFVSVIEDIQQRKESELALHETNLKMKKLSLLASKTQHSVVISDAAGKIEWVNDAFTELTGYTMNEVLGRKPGDFLRGPNTDPKTIEKIHKRIKEYKSVAVEIVNYAKDGHEYWIALNIDPVFSDEGVLTNYIATQVDITDRKRAENEAFLSKERFDCLMKSDIIGIQVCHSNGRILQANDEFLSIIGYSREDLNSGKLNWKKLTPPEWDDQDKSVLQQIEEIGAARPCEKEYYRKDGTRIPVVVGMVKLDKENDTNLKFVLNATSQKEAREKLQAAKQAAEEASRAKSEFLAVMSHELRTPLNGLIGMTELLANSQLDDRQERFVSACQSSGHELLSLINEILDLSKIESGHLTLEHHPFDLLEVLEDITKSMSMRIEAKGVDLRMEMANPSTLILDGDAQRIRQVLVNLLGNAAKFTERGNITLSAAPQLITEETITVRFKVTDTGIGIPAAKLDRLFHKFTQVDESISRKYGGTGLGLSISKRIVEAMGGTIGVNSVEGVGSEFWFTIPFKRCRNCKPLLPSSSAPWEKAQVLVIEDNQYCRQFLKLVIESLGHTCYICPNAQSARERLLSHSGEFAHSVILLNSEVADCGMEIHSYLRRNKELEHIPVIEICSTGKQEHAGDGRRFLQTPLTTSKVVSALSILEAQGPVEKKNTSAGLKKLDREATGRFSLSVLVADDNETNQLYEQELLSQFGCSCASVGNGVDVLSELECREYDVILMDCRMPEMDGFETTRAIRRRESLGIFRKRTPIIAVTANAIRGDRERCLKNGMDYYLAKPFRPEDLREILKQVAQNQSGSSDAGCCEVDSKPDSQEPIQKEELLQRCLGDLSFAQSLLDSFQRDSRKRLDEIDQAFQLGNTAEIAESAHGLKGISGIIAAQTIMRTAAAVEISCESDSLDEIKKSIDTLHLELESCFQQIPSLLEELQNADDS